MPAGNCYYDELATVLCLFSVHFRWVSQAKAYYNDLTDEIAFICIKITSSMGLWRDLRIFNLTKDVNGRPKTFYFVNQKSTYIFSP